MATLESKIIAVLNPVFNNRIWFDAIPDAVNPDAPVCVVNQVGGAGRAWFLDGSMDDWDNARLQFFIWGRDRIEVDAKQNEMHEALRAVSNSIDTYIAPVGGSVSDYNEPLKLKGIRADYQVWFKAV